MRLLVINPNTTESMTDKIRTAASSAAAPGTEIIAVNPMSGPPSIEGHFDAAFAVPGVIDEIRKAGPVDATVIACFDDTGLDAARCIGEAPVIGIGEAAYHMASLVAQRFSVITTLSRSVPIIEHNLDRYGLARRCSRVRATDVAVLELESPDSPARERISLEIARAIEEDAAEAIVLGCAGMADLAAMLAARHDLPVIDGVVAAVKMAEGLAGLGLRTSKRGGYAQPRQKAYTGNFAAFSPRSHEVAG